MLVGKREKVEFAETVNKFSNRFKVGRCAGVTNVTSHSPG